MKARAGRTASRRARCAACGADGAAPAFEARGLKPSDPAFVLVRCPGCGLGWTEPPVPDSEIGRWYPPSYYGKENVRFNALFEALVRFFRWRRARVIARRAPPGPVLDVGCGRGRLLSHLQSMGYEPHGVELTEEGAWHARARLGLDVFVGDFLSAPYGPGQFACVVFWHSLEHLSRPVEALRRASAILKEGGLLVIAVPNSESLQARLTGPDWFHLDIPRHYHHFGTRSLTALLEGLGFRPVKADHFSFEQNPYGWIQSLYNAMGLEFNFLYSILKNRSSRMVPVRKHPLQALLILALLPLVVPLALALTVLEAALRRGGTIEVYAVKEGVRR